MIERTRSQLEKGGPRWGARLAGLGILALAIVLSGTRSTAGQDKDKEKDQDTDPKTKEVKKDEVKKDAPKKTGKVKKESPIPADALKPLKEFSKSLPSEQRKEMEKAMKEMQTKMRKHLEEQRGNAAADQNAMKKLYENQATMQQGMYRAMRGPGGSTEDRLGIMVTPLSADAREHLDLPKDKGMVVAVVGAGSAAEKAGVKPLDILLQVNGKDIASESESLTKSVAGIKADTEFDIVVLRKNKKETLKGIKLPEKATPFRMPGAPAVGATTYVVPGSPQPTPKFILKGKPSATQEKPKENGKTAPKTDDKKTTPDKPKLPPPAKPADTEKPKEKEPEKDKGN